VRLTPPYPHCCGSEYAAATGIASPSTGVCQSPSLAALPCQDASDSPMASVSFGAVSSPLDVASCEQCGTSCAGGGGNGRDSPPLLPPLLLQPAVQPVTAPKQPMCANTTVQPQQGGADGTPDLAPNSCASAQSPTQPHLQRAGHAPAAHVASPIPLPPPISFDDAMHDQAHEGELIDC
jgi:hypothetical protein